MSAAPSETAVPTAEIASADAQQQALVPPRRCDVVVVGGGIVGLAVARELNARHPGASICVLERERSVAAHQSGHNSGVIHSGIYYAGGSLKAKLCVEGARELYRYCRERGIPFQRCGKLIVACGRSEMSALQELHRRGEANGVSDLRLLDGEQIAEVEPHAAGFAALHSPQTGVVDFGAVARSYAEDIRAAGGTVVTGCEVSKALEAPGGVSLEHFGGSTQARYAIFCAGAWSDRLAVACGAEADPRIVPFRGAYLKLRPHVRERVRGLIYPVPDARLPFLGVHLTRTIDDEVLVGPTALLAGARDAYRLRRLSARDLLDTVSWPGSWRMLSRWWRTAATELHQALDHRAVVRAAARYLPGLQPQDVEPAFAGVRAQALRRDGALVDDFVFSYTPRTLHVRNAPSPGATSALAIARHVVDTAKPAIRL
jgi:2-hydroxyglutarate dehydrogenase